MHASNGAQKIFHPWGPQFFWEHVLFYYYLTVTFLNHGQIKMFVRILGGFDAPRHSAFESCAEAVPSGLLIAWKGAKIPVSLESEE